MQNKPTKKINMKSFLVTYAEELDKQMFVPFSNNVEKRFKTVPIEATSKEDAFRIARNKLSLHWSQIEIIKEINI